MQRKTQASTRNSYDAEICSNERFLKQKFQIEFIADGKPTNDEHVQEILEQGSCPTFSVFEVIKFSPIQFNQHFQLFRTSRLKVNY